MGDEIGTTQQLRREQAIRKAKRALGAHTREHKGCGLGAGCAAYEGLWSSLAELQREHKRLGPTLSNAKALAIFKAEKPAAVRGLEFSVSDEDHVVWWTCEALVDGAWYAAQFCELDPEVAYDWSGIDDDDDDDEQQLDPGSSAPYAGPSVTHHSNHRTQRGASDEQQLDAGSSADQVADDEQGGRDAY